MDDGEFWEAVFNSHQPLLEYEVDDGDTVHGLHLDPCPVCGSVTECGNDELGRPLIHVFSDEAWFRDVVMPERERWVTEQLGQMMEGLGFPGVTFVMEPVDG
jgi:hypothetical protein